jgi:hypothetical protein
MIEREGHETSLRKLAGSNHHLKLLGDRACSILHVEKIFLNVENGAGSVS